MTKPKGGIPAVLEMLELLEPEARDKLLANLAAKDPEIARALELGLFTFEDIVHLSPRHTQELLHAAPQATLILALRKASDALKAHVFANMAKRAAEELKSLMAAQSPQRLADVNKAQAELIELARRLESQGKILLKKEHD